MAQRDGPKGLLRPLSSSSIKAAQGMIQISVFDTVFGFDRRTEEEQIEESLGHRVVNTFDVRRDIHVI